MIISFFLAKLLGIYFLLIAAIWLVRREQFEKLGGDMVASDSLLGLSGIISLIFGIIIVLLHPVWVWGWPVIITLIGYISILQGILRIGFPSTVQKMVPRMMKIHWIPWGIVTVLGLFLTYEGFFGSLL
jgi:uncharacterized protein YjeT (DUF2065 family)